MADEDDFFFKVYAKETLLKKKLREIPLEAQAIVFRMWCVCCLEGSISADPEEIAQACCLKFSEVELVRTHMQSLMRFFYVAHDASLHSAFMEEERGKATGKSAKCRDAANIRWGNKSNADAYADGDAKRNAKPMPHSHSQSKNPEPPQGLTPTDVAHTFLSETMLSGKRTLDAAAEACRVRTATGKPPEVCMSEIIAEWKNYLRVTPQQFQTGPEKWLESCNKNLASKPKRPLPEPASVGIKRRIAAERAAQGVQ